MATDDGDKTIIRAPGEGFNADRTVIRPRPGGRGAPPAAPAALPPQAIPGTPVRGAGFNPLVDAATTLLALAGQLRGSIAQPDVAGLRNHVVREIQTFEDEARTAGVRPELVLAGRYGLCTLLDEFVLSTPWGSEGPWSQETLLSTFHKETFGGEKFFRILERMAQEPASNLELLELYHICLLLGFEGMYRVAERGHMQLDQVRDNLHRTIHAQRGAYERPLSPRWQGIDAPLDPGARRLPLWAVAALAGAILVLAYVAASFGLNRSSDPVYGRLAAIGRTPPAAVAAPPPAPIPPPAIVIPAPEPAPAAPTLRQLLAGEVENGRLDVLEKPDREVVVLRGDGLFASGSALVRADLQPLLLRVADALDQLPGRIVVSGHSDNVPIRTLRFPSNWHLSQARAEAVVQMLGERLADSNRLVAEGRSDTEPVAPNDTPGNRALNRRVEVTLMGGGLQP